VAARPIRMTLRTFGCVLLAGASLAGFVAMIVLLIRPPSAEVPFADGGGGHIQVDCRSIADAADVASDQHDDVTDVDASGATTPADDRPELAWCADERTARAAYIGLLAVPTTLCGAGSIAVGMAARRRPS
jgi:hypothetical protein